MVKAGANKIGPNRTAQREHQKQVTQAANMVKAGAYNIGPKQTTHRGHKNKLLRK